MRFSGIELAILNLRTLEVAEIPLANMYAESMAFVLDDNGTVRIRLRQVGAIS
jgi:hypothetical protein